MSYDLAVVGAGPAGLSAAVTVARVGGRVVLLDSAPQAGGQFWRHRPGSGGSRRTARTYAALRAELLSSDVDYHPAAAVWFVEAAPDHFLLHVEGLPVVRARHVLFATGSYDRVLPFPGWHLPGVVTAGGAQALLLGSGVPVGFRVVVAGSGPFLLAVASHLLAAGVRVVGVYESGRPLRYLRRPWALHLRRVWEAAGYLARLARYRVPYRTSHAVVAAHGSHAVEAVEVARLDRRGRVVPGSLRRVECDAVAVGHGFTPQLELALALGCATRLDVDGNLVLDVDVAGRTSVPGVFAAGEVTGIGGADLALVEGRLVATAVALSLGRPSPFTETELSRLLARRAGHRRFADLMHRVHAPPPHWDSWLHPRTLVCRCEEVPVAAVRRAVQELGATTGRAVKGLTRVGMGWCQGRMCGYAAAALTARLCNRRILPDDLETFYRRPLAQPVTLSTLAEPDGDV